MRGSSLSKPGLVTIRAGSVTLEGDLQIPDNARGVVVFAHGSGSGRFSPRNRYVAGEFQSASLATLLIDLLSQEEEAVDRHTGHLRFDIPLLADRLLAATHWLGESASTGSLPVGYFGASTGGGAALVAAAATETVRAVVSRGGRPDLAGDALPLVRCPTLLIVGGRDLPVLELNRKAMARMRAKCLLEIVPGATHLFEEPGTLESVARLARDWFLQYLPASTPLSFSGQARPTDG
jgi:putative phosphoribosyl transferase